MAFSVSGDREYRRNRNALFDGIEEGGIRATSSSHEIDEHENDRALDGLQDRVILLKRLTGDVHEEVENHNLMLDRMGNDMDSSRGILSGTMDRFKTVFETKSSRRMFTLVVETDTEKSSRDLADLIDQFFDAWRKQVRARAAERYQWLTKICDDEIRTLRELLEVETNMEKFRRDLRRKKKKKERAKKWYRMIDDEIRALRNNKIWEEDELEQKHTNTNDP